MQALTAGEAQHQALVDEVKMLALGDVEEDDE